MPAVRIEEKPLGCLHGSSNGDEEEVLGGAKRDSGGEEVRGAEDGAPRPGDESEAGVEEARNPSDALDGKIVRQTGEDTSNRPVSLRHDCLRTA